MHLYYILRLHLNISYVHFHFAFYFFFFTRAHTYTHITSVFRIYFRAGGWDMDFNFLAALPFFKNNNDNNKDKKMFAKLCTDIL